MKVHLSRWLFLSLIALGAAAAGAEPPVPDHRALGEAAGKRDFAGLVTLCEPAGPAPDLAVMRRRKWAMPSLLPSAMPFDNLVFLGNRSVSAWAIKTSEGLILIDALDNEAEARVTIEDGLKRLGLDPASIRILIITHAHGDHYGGAQYLIDKYHPRVVMSERDWQLLEDPAQRIDLPEWGPAPKRDQSIKGRGKVVLGDTSIDILETPGHTPGTISLIFPVFDRGVRHEAVLWGGTGFNFGPLADRYRAYARSASAMKVEVLRRGIDVFLSNHVKRDYTDRKLEEMAGGAKANPFILTPERTAAAFETFTQCALQQLDYIK